MLVNLFEWVVFDFFLLILFVIMKGKRLIFLWLKLVRNVKIGN